MERRREGACARTTDRVVHCEVGLSWLVAREARRRWEGDGSEGRFRLLQLPSSVTTFVEDISAAELCCDRGPASSERGELE